MTKLSSLTVWAGLACLMLAGCGSSKANEHRSKHPLPEPPGKIVVYNGPAPSSETRHVIVAKLPHLGWVLVNGKGYVLYAFVPTNPGAKCEGACEATWPVFQLTHGKVLDVSPDLELPRVKVEPDPEGGRRVRFAGWLLHSYNGDSEPDVASGQGLSSDGGHWYAISTSGKLVTHPR